MERGKLIVFENGLIDINEKKGFIDWQALCYRLAGNNYDYAIRYDFPSCNPIGSLIKTSKLSEYTDTTSEVMIELADIFDTFNRKNGISEKLNLGHNVILTSGFLKPVVDGYMRTSSKDRIDNILTKLVNMVAPLFADFGVDAYLIFDHSYIVKNTPLLLTKDLPFSFISDNIKENFYLYKDFLDLNHSLYGVDYTILVSYNTDDIVETVNSLLK